MLVHLSEFSFKVVPIFVREPLEAMFRSMLTTLPVENAMNHLTSRQESNPGKKLQSRSRWHTLMTSNLMEDFEFKHPNQNELASFGEARSGKATPDQVFLSKASDFSLGADVLESLGGNAWPSPSPATYNAIAYSMKCLQSVNGDWSAMKCAWLSLLLAPRTIITTNISERMCAYLVISVSKWGCLVWPVKRSGVPSFRFFDPVYPAAGSSHPVSQWIVLNWDTLNSYDVRETKVLAPGMTYRSTWISAMHHWGALHHPGL